MPVTKVQRATKFIATGAKIGTNYLKHYGKKLVNPDVPRAELHEDNAKDIYNSLSQLRGGALKIAQMLSLDKNILPTAYQQQFALAQYSAPPLSFPLVVKTFQKYFGKGPEQIFDTFTRTAVNAASMGQVHQATLNGKKLAVKVQYPGVADSIQSDLAMVRPIAFKMFNLKEAEFGDFIAEVEMRMMEETDYTLELQRSMDLSAKSNHLNDVVFPAYYPDLSCERILVMDWIEGKPLGDFLNADLPEGVGNKLGQAMWDFYQFQMHQLKAVHADPHPGNFIITPDYKLGIIDFGCVKVIPQDFYESYFRLLERDFLTNEAKQAIVFRDLRFLDDSDTAREREIFKRIFLQMLELLGRPFRSEFFDFSDKAYFESLFAFGEETSKIKELRASNKPRGVRDALYINRTYFGLFNLLHQLKAHIRTQFYHQEAAA